MKLCPYCAEEIQNEAIVCKHCGRDLTTNAINYPRTTGLEEAQKKANNALTSAIVGFFCFGIILGPVSITRAREAKKILRPGDPGYGSAQAAEIIGWIVTALYVIGLCVSAFSFLASNGYQ